MKKTGLTLFVLAVFAAGGLLAGCKSAPRDTTEGGKYTFDKLCEKVAAEAETMVSDQLDNSGMTAEQKEIAKAAAAGAKGQMKDEIVKGCEDMKKQVMSQVPDEKKQKIAEGAYVKALMESCKDQKGMKYMECMKNSEPKALEEANKLIK